MKLTIVVLILCSTHCFGQSKSIKEVFLFAVESVKFLDTIRHFNYSSSFKYSSFEFSEFSSAHKLEGQVPKSFWQVSHDSATRITQVEFTDSVNHLKNISFRVNRKGDLSILYGYSIDPRQTEVVSREVLENGDEVTKTSDRQFPIDGFLVIDHKRKRMFFLETYLYPGKLSGNTSMISGIMLLDENLFPVKRMDICNRKIKDITEYAYSVSKVAENRHLLSESESERLGLIDDLTLNDVYGILKCKIKKIDDTATITEDTNKDCYSSMVVYDLFTSVL